MIINAKNIAAQLDSSVILYENVFETTQEIVDQINNNSEKASVSLYNTQPNIKVTINPFETDIMINCEKVKQDMASHGVDMKNAIMGIIYDGINKIYK